jgi:hypothetical protein
MELPEMLKQYKNNLFILFNVNLLHAPTIVTVLPSTVSFFI